MFEITADIARTNSCRHKKPDSFEKWMIDIYKVIENSSKQGKYCCYYEVFLDETNVETIRQHLLNNGFEVEINNFTKIHKQFFIA